MQRQGEWVDTSYRPAEYQRETRLPSSFRRLSCTRRSTYGSDLGLVDRPARDHDQSSPEASGVDEDLDDRAAATPAWLQPASPTAPPTPSTSALPTATRRLSRTPGSPPEHKEDSSLNETRRLWAEEDDRAASTPAWLQPAAPTAPPTPSASPLPTTTRRLSRTPGSSPEREEDRALNETRRPWAEDEGPPLPAQFWSAVRQRQLQVAAREAVEEPPPWWWYPCYHSDPDTPWYDPKVKFGADTFWDPALCADHIYIGCKMAVSDAINSQEKQFANAWHTSLTNLQEMFEGIEYDWMPEVAKKPERPVDNRYYINSTFDREMIGCHNNLQVVSVPVDQIIREQQKGSGEFLPIWYSVKTHLRQVLCDAECGLYHMNVPKRDVPRSVMPDGLRDLRGFDQQARDWIIFRDYKNLMQFYEHIFLRHAFYQ